MSVGKIYRTGLPYSNVVPTGVATNQITPGKTLESIMLQLGGTAFTKAMISMIKLKANGKAILEASGSQLDKLLAYRGYTSNAAFLEIPFEDLTGLTELDRVVGSLDTSNGIASLTTEVTIAGATAPTLESRLYESATQKDRAGNAAIYAPLMCKILRYPFAAATGGKLPVTLPFGPQNGAIIKRVHFEAANMTACTVKQDGIVVFEATKAQNEYEQQRNKRTPQTGWFTIDFMLEGNIKECMDTRDARSMEWLPEFSAADSGYILVEYLDVLGNL